MIHLLNFSDKYVIKIFNYVSSLFKKKFIVDTILQYK